MPDRDSFDQRFEQGYTRAIGRSRLSVSKQSLNDIARSGFDNGTDRLMAPMLRKARRMRRHAPRDTRYSR
jgi:hypothetical protein